MTQRARELRANGNSAEKRIWSMLRSSRLAGLKFRRQYVIGKYVADFVCLSARLVIEIDGDTHDEDARIKDAKRTEDLEAAGYRVIRFWNNYVLSDRDGGVADAIFEALRLPTSRAPPPSPPPPPREGRWCSLASPPLPHPLSRRRTIIVYLPPTYLTLLSTRRVGQAY